MMLFHLNVRAYTNIYIMLLFKYLIGLLFAFAFVEIRILSGCTVIKGNGYTFGGGNC